MTGALLAARFCDQADRRGNRMLIADDTSTASGHDAAALVQTKMTAYAGAGVGETSRVGTVAWPPLDFVTDVFTVVGLGGVVVPLPRRVSAWELRRIDGLAALTHLAVDTGSSLGLHRIRADVGGRRLSSCLEHVDVPGHGAAAGQLTSGTTGHQRLALRPAAALAVEAERYATALRLTPEETIVCPVPLHHAYG